MLIKKVDRKSEVGQVTDNKRKDNLKIDYNTKLSQSR